MNLDLNIVNENVDENAQINDKETEAEENFTNISPPIQTDDDFRRLFEGWPPRSQEDRDGREDLEDIKDLEDETTSVDCNCIAPTPRPSETVNELPTIIISDDSTECTLCQRKFKLGDLAKVMPCEHFFHVDCLLSWINETNTDCPTCRFELDMSDAEKKPDSLFL